jgi:hypothetical protein
MFKYVGFIPPVGDCTGSPTDPGPCVVQPQPNAILEGFKKIHNGLLRIA